MHSGSSEVSSADLIDTSSGEGDARMSPDGPIQGCSYAYSFQESAPFSPRRGRLQLVLGVIQTPRHTYGKPMSWRVS